MRHMAFTATLNPRIVVAETKLAVSSNSVYL